jgi:hypothetical protein
MNAHFHIDVTGISHTGINYLHPGYQRTHTYLILLMHESVITCMHTSMYSTYTCMYTSICMYVCMYICMYICMYARNLTVISSIYIYIT